MKEQQHAGVPLRRVPAVEGAGRRFSTPSRPALRAAALAPAAALRGLARLAAACGDDEAAKRVRRYWEVQAWLVVEAEEAMMEEAVGDAEFDAEMVRAAFAELDGLKTALGRSTLAALQALLPFSRNDLWEVAELRQRLNRR